MDTRRGKEKFKNIRILFDSGFSYKILMVRLVENLLLERDTVMQWHAQDRNFTTNLKVEVDFTLPALSATNVVMWKFDVDEYVKGKNDMILEQDLLT